MSFPLKKKRNAVTGLPPPNLSYIKRKTQKARNLETNISPIEQINMYLKENVLRRNLLLMKPITYWHSLSLSPSLYIECQKRYGVTTVHYKTLS